MVPEALGAFLAFLGIVAPGIFFELRREKRRIGVTGWSFRDISAVALVGLSLTGVALALTFGFGRLFFGAARVPDPEAWAQQGGSYFSAHFYPVVIAIAAVFVVALLLALVLAWGVAKWGGRREGSLAKHSLWHQAFHDDAPEGATPWVHVELTDGSAFFGDRRASTEGEDVDNREITLTGPKLSYRPPRGADGAVRDAQVIGDRWDYVVIRSSQIRYLRVQYLEIGTGKRVDRWRTAEAPPAAREPVKA